MLPFLDRREERALLGKLPTASGSHFAVVYGRRRAGKSRLLQEALPRRNTLYYAADDRESPLQRAALAEVGGTRIDGLERAVYPDWDALLARLLAGVPPGTIIVIDEFPALVRAAPELPSLLQRHLDRRPRPPVHLVIAGSSQRLMQGLVLDRTAPLFGRADIILPVGPLPAGWIRTALRLRDARRAVEAYSVWGGLPRYWELAREFSDVHEALKALVLSPLGVLHEEPRMLLLDDLRETVQASSLLSLVARGCHRLSEIAARVEKPATSLVRPLQRLLDLGLVGRDVPFGSTLRDTKRTLYRVSDPFLQFWFRWVEPSWSLLEARQVERVAAGIRKGFPQHVAGAWEDLARASVARLEAFGHHWRPASRWWGTGLDRQPMELDVVAERDDGRGLLVGEARWSARADAPRLVRELQRKAAQFPLAAGREVHLALWLPRRAPAGPAQTFSAADVMEGLR